MSGLAAIAVASVAAWLYLLFARGEFWRIANREEPVFPAPTTWPSVAVIIPARNEADMLPHSLPTLLSHDYPALHIILVDDHSEDGTDEIAARIIQDHRASNATVIQAASRPSSFSPLPFTGEGGAKRRERGILLNALTHLRFAPAPSPAIPLRGREREIKSEGWKGKPWAMQCGLEYIAAQPRRARYVLFTDADIAYDKGVLKKLVARAEAENLALASLMVRLRCKSFAEKFFIPAFVFFFQMLYPFRWVREGKCAAAAGGCMLVRYDALQNAGGLAPISSALIDDCALAHALKPHGRLWLELTQNVHSLRPYPHVGDIRAMVARTAYDQLNYSPLNLIAATLGMALVFIAPVWLSFSAIGEAQFCGLLTWIGMTIAFGPILRFYRCPLLLGVALPLIALFYMGFTLDSAWQYYQGRGGAWKGRAQACAST